MDRRRRVRSYEEDMTPPRGMRNFRSNAVPTDEPMPPPRSFEEDMTPPPGMRNFRSNAVPSNEPIPGRPSRMKEGGAVKMKSGGVTRGDGCATRGKTKGRMV
jgi:hypothetical protein